MLNEEKKIRENEKYIIEELREHDGWAEIKIKNKHIIEARKKVVILGRKNN